MELYILCFISIKSFEVVLRYALGNFQVDLKFRLSLAIFASTFGTPYQLLEVFTRIQGNIKLKKQAELGEGGPHSRRRSDK